MRTPQQWANLKLDQDIRLLLGWRETEDLEAAPVDMTAEIGKEMRDACLSTLRGFLHMDAKAYSGIPSIDEDEFLSLAIEEPDEDEEDDTEPLLEERLSAAAMRQLAQTAFERDDFLDRSDLFDGGWLFYAVVGRTVNPGEPIAFIKQFNPQRGFDPGRILSAYSGALARVKDPVFNFDLNFDMVLAPDEIAILRLTAFERVFADVAVVAQRVPGNVSDLKAALAVKLQKSAEQTLQSACTDRIRLAARLNKLVRQPHLSSVTPATLKQALHRHGLPKDRFGSGDTVALSDATDVRQFLDVLEKRYYEADFTGEHLRADNYSPRP